MRLFVFGLLFFSLRSQAQKNNLLPFIEGKSIKDSVSLDFNGDRLKDLAMVVYTDNNAAKANREKQLVILASNADKTYSKILQTSQLFGDSTCCGVMGRDPYTGLRVKKNTLVIEFETGGSVHRNEVSYSFKSIHDTLYCVAFESWEYNLPLNDNSIHVSQADYLSGTSQEYDVVGDKKLNFHKIPLKIKPLLTIDAIKCPFSCE